MLTISTMRTSAPKTWRNIGPVTELSKRSTLSGLVFRVHVQKCIWREPDGTGLRPGKGFRVLNWRNEPNVSSAPHFNDQRNEKCNHSHQQSDETRPVVPNLNKAQVKIV